jgi:hypothetical protein
MHALRSKLIRDLEHEIGEEDQCRVRIVSNLAGIFLVNSADSFICGPRMKYVLDHQFTIAVVRMRLQITPVVTLNATVKLKGTLKPFN